MGDQSAIEWTDATWNPTVGCTKVSPGCDHCYAETFVNRFAGTKGFPLPFDQLLLRDESFLTLPLRWRKPRKIFVNSLSDLFHQDVPDEFIAQVFAVMALTRRHTFQLLTKRHARLRSLLNDDDFHAQVAEAASDVMGSGVRGIEVNGVGDGWHVTGQDLEGANIWSPSWPLPNVWLGVSVENQQWADIRIPALLATPAAVRWISAEPLLGPIDITGWAPENDDARWLDWVVVGGESGPKARAMRPEWPDSLLDQCGVLSVPFLFKQWGNWAPTGKVSDRTVMANVGKKRAGRTLRGQTWDGYPPDGTPARMAAS
jgi:protein gp37